MVDDSELSQWQSYTLRLLELQDQRHQMEIQRLIEAFTGLRTAPLFSNKSEPNPSFSNFSEQVWNF